MLEHPAVIMCILGPGLVHVIVPKCVSGVQAEPSLTLTITITRAYINVVDAADDSCESDESDDGCCMYQETHSVIGASSPLRN